MIAKCCSSHTLFDFSKALRNIFSSEAIWRRNGHWFSKGRRRSREQITRYVVMEIGLTALWEHLFSSQSVGTKTLQAAVINNKIKILSQRKNLYYVSVYIIHNSSKTHQTKITTIKFQSSNKALNLINKMSLS